MESSLQGIKCWYEVYKRKKQDSEEGELDFVENNEDIHSSDFKNDQRTSALSAVILGGKIQMPSQKMFLQFGQH